MGKVREKFNAIHKIAIEMKSQNKNVLLIVQRLFEEDATLAMTIKSLNNLGYKSNEIDGIINNCDAWKGNNQSHEDLFFDFVELDDDLIEP
jgi:Holliday junction resolvasome RuvABC DNA-binding subunit